MRKWLFFFPVLGLLMGFDLPSKNHKMILRHLDNGMTYCMAYERRPFKEGSLQLAFSCEEGVLGIEEQVVASVVQREILAQMQEISREFAQITPKKTRARSDAHSTIYRLDLHVSSPKNINGAITALQEALSRVYLRGPIDSSATQLVDDIADDDLREKMQEYCSKIGPERIRAFMAEYYVPSRATLFVVGGGRGVDLREALSPFFAFINPHDKPEREGVSLHPIKGEEVGVSVYYDIPDFQEEKERALASIFQAALKNRVHPRKGMGVPDFVMNLLERRDTSQIRLSKRCYAEDSGELLEKLFLEIESMKSFGPSFDELAELKLSLFPEWVDCQGREEAQLITSLDVAEWGQKNLSLNPVIDIAAPYDSWVVPDEISNATKWLSKNGLIKTKSPYHLCTNEASHDRGVFYTLPINDSERSKITEIIHTMGKHSVFSLLWKKSHLEKIGDQIDHVHPLRFLWHVFTNNQLKKDMKEIYKSSFKWSGFMDGCKRKLIIMDRTNKLEPFVPGFVQEVGVDYDAFMSYIKKKDWDGMVHFLIKS